MGKGRKWGVLLLTSELTGNIYIFIFFFFYHKLLGIGWWCQTFSWKSIKSLKVLRSVCECVFAQCGSSFLIIWTKHTSSNCAIIHGDWKSFWVHFIGENWNGEFQDEKQPDLANHEFMMMSCDIDKINDCDGSFWTNWSIRTDSDVGKSSELDGVRLMTHWTWFSIKGLSVTNEIWEAGLCMSVCVCVQWTHLAHVSGIRC